MVSAEDSIPLLRRHHWRACTELAIPACDERSVFRRRSALHALDVRWRSEMTIETHPIQMPFGRPNKPVCPKVVTLAAYEVYCHVYGEQEALITGNCRGGFGVGELVAFLYARSFPKHEWRARVDEAFNGMGLDK
jgi:hypothetical protein